MKKNYLLFFFILFAVLSGFFLYEKYFLGENGIVLEKKQIETEREKVYIDSDGLFRFEYPASVTVNQFVETSPSGDEKKIILGRGEKSGEDFQIAVSSFTDTDPITDKKIKKDIPDQIIREAQNIQIKGSQGVAFLSSPEGSQNVREVWFSHAGFLYQISALSEMDQVVARMIETWVWGQE